jgi:hypothetical protein
MKNEGGREAGKCSKKVSNRGSVCLYFLALSSIQSISVSALLRKIVRQLAQK